MWHRDDRITGRDIFDFALIVEREPHVLMPAREFMTRHAAAVFQLLDERYVQLKQQFDAVDALRYHPTFEQACGALKAALTAMLETAPLLDDATDVDVEAADRPATPAV